MVSRCVHTHINGESLFYLNTEDCRRGDIFGWYTVVLSLPCSEPSNNKKYCAFVYEHTLIHVKTKLCYVDCNFSNVHIILKNCEYC